jgi:DNA-binding transcriptional MerR regulator
MHRRPPCPPIATRLQNVELSLREIREQLPRSAARGAPQPVAPPALAMELEAARGAEAELLMQIAGRASQQEQLQALARLARAQRDVIRAATRQIREEPGR